MNMPNKLTRRTLLAATASVASAQSTRANSAVSIALIGCGGRGRTLMRDLVSHTPARLSAVCDLRPERMRQARAEAEERGTRPAVNGSMESVLASPDIDAVIVATPVFLHADHLEAAVRAGKHVYIEKPAMPDVAGCKRMMRIADSADRKLNLTIGFQRRYGRSISKPRRCSTPARRAPSAWSTCTSSKARVGIKSRVSPSRAPRTKRSAVGTSGAIFPAI